MINFNELTLKTQNLIQSEISTNSDLTYLKSEHAKLIAQIVSNYKLEPQEGPTPSAQMIFLGAPTGAGKDTLVRKILSQNPDKKFVVLNMDMFRYYHTELSQEPENISDKDFAKKTNQSSYEIFYIIQELILREFPGTNIIVTGTMRNLDWVKEIISRYKKDPKTKYKISLVTLAVPIKETAFSIFERYLNMVNTRGKSTLPLRYTELDYHDDTTNKFISNVQSLESDLAYNPQNSVVDAIQVYKRNQNINDLSEDNLVYDSASSSENGCATAHIHDIMYTSSNISPDRIANLVDIIERNADYLKKQNLYESILTDLKNMFLENTRNSADLSK